MRKIGWMTLALAGVLMAGPAQAQTLDEVLDNHYEAIGGLDAWQSLRSMKSEGSLNVMGFEAPLAIMGERPNKFRMEFTIQGAEVVQAYDGTTAWQIMPLMGINTPQAMPAEQAASFADQADFDGVLIGWKDRGVALELEGAEDLEGTPTYKLKAVTGTGTQYIFLDAETYLPVRIDSEGSAGNATTQLSDYRPVGGLLFPHSIENSSGMGQVTITLSSIQVNTDIDDSLFSMP